MRRLQGLGLEHFQRESFDFPPFFCYNLTRHRGGSTAVMRPWREDR
jgi:hypothetical protein